MNDLDGDLLRRARRGDRSACHDMVGRYGPGLYRIAVSMVGNIEDAEDILQETFSGAFDGLERFEGRSSIRTWLTRILVNHVARCRRRYARKPTLPLDETVDNDRSDPAPGNRGEATDAPADAKLDLQSALGRLPPEQRDVIVLREFDGLSYDEMAQVLEIPRGTVESRLFRARAALKDLLKDYLE